METNEKPVMDGSFVGKTVEYGHGKKLEITPENHGQFVENLIDRSMSVGLAFTEAQQRASALTEIMSQLGDCELTTLAIEALRHIQRARHCWIDYHLKAEEMARQSAPSTML